MQVFNIEYTEKQNCQTMTDLTTRNAKPSELSKLIQIGECSHSE